MSSILRAGKMRHAINAGESCAVAAVAVRIELLLGEDVTTFLERSGLEGVETRREA
jgi:hypothetical protein